MKLTKQIVKDLEELSQIVGVASREKRVVKAIEKKINGLVDKIEKILGTKVQVDYVQASVRTMLADKTLMGRLGKFHLIYSMGLFDYLNTPVAKVVFESLYRLLNQGGELIIGNFHISNPSRNFMEYWGDWYLIHRTEAEFRDLMPDADSADTHVIFEETRSQMFLHTP